MNQTFNWSRFGKLLKSDARNLWPNFGLSFLILSLLPLALWLICMVLGKHGPDNVAPEIRWSIILTMSALACILAPSRLYKNCNARNNGIYFAMLPASKLEKFLSMLIFCIVVAPLAVLLGGMVADTVIWALPLGPYNQSLFVNGNWLTEEALSEATANLFDPYTVGLFVKPGKMIVILLLAYLGWCTTFIFTNTIFHKHKVISTILWVGLISFVLQLILMPLSISFIGKDPEWLRNWMEAWEPLHFYNAMLWVNILGSAAYSIVLLWWSSFRLKRMKY